jgi:hypothetical protein
MDAFLTGLTSGAKDGHTEKDTAKEPHGKNNFQAVQAGGTSEHLRAALLKSNTGARRVDATEPSKSLPTCSLLSQVMTWMFPSQISKSNTLEKPENDDNNIGSSRSQTATGTPPFQALNKAKNRR